MGLKLSQVPNHLLEKMSKEDRAGHLTAMEAIEKGNHRTEAREQGTFAQWLNLAQERGELHFIWFRTDKPTHTKPGHPDFTVFLSRGRTLFFEMKAPKTGRLSKEQKQISELLASLGFFYCIIYSAEEGIQIVRKLLA